MGDNITHINSIPVDGSQGTVFPLPVSLAGSGGSGGSVPIVGGPSDPSQIRSGGGSIVTTNNANILNPGAGNYAYLTWLMFVNATGADTTLQLFQYGGSGTTLVDLLPLAVGGIVQFNFNQVPWKSTQSNALAMRSTVATTLRYSFIGFIDTK